jgi:hypothetical protein
VTDEQRSMAAKGQGLGCQEFRSWGTNMKRSKNHGLMGGLIRWEHSAVKKALLALLFVAPAVR